MAPPISWTDERIKKGLERFHNEYGRYPSAREFDTCEYLPTARQLQRRYMGGLPEFREKFKLEGQFNLTTGQARSAVAKRNIQRSYNYEEEFYGYLLDILPAHLIHEQKRLRPGNIACDFFVYVSKTEGIALDLFYAMDIWSLARIVNIKLKRYELLPRNQEIYFISITNHKIDQISVDKMMGSRKSKVPNNICVMTEEEFKAKLKTILNWKEA
jgi:hypothetical protein